MTEEINPQTGKPYKRSKETRQRQSEAQKKRPPRKYSAERNKKVSEGLKKRHKENPEDRKKVGLRNKEAYSKDKDWQELLSRRQKELWSNPEIRAKRISGLKEAAIRPTVVESRSKGSRLAWKNSPNREERVRLACKSLSDYREKSSRKFFAKESSLEKEIREYLELKSVVFEQEFKLENKFYDFKIGEYLLEVHSTYFHADSRVYHSKYNNVFPHQKKHKENDSFKAKLATKHSFKYRVLWQKEIRNKDLSIIDKIISKIKGEVE